MSPDDLLASAFSSPGEDPPALPHARLRLSSALGRRRRRWPLAAAAALLAAAWGFWKVQTTRPTAPLRDPAPSARMLAAGESLAGSGTAWLGAGTRVRLSAGRIERLPGGLALRLESGALEVDHFLPLPLEIRTPAGSVRGERAWRGRLRLGEAPSVLFREAEAGEARLGLEVWEGEVLLEGLRISAGEKAEGAPGNWVRGMAGRPPASRDVLPGIRGSLETGAYPIPFPSGEAYGFSVRYRPLTPESRLALALPIRGRLRLWQWPAPAGDVHEAAAAVLDLRGEGVLDGRACWSTGDALAGLQEASGQAGLRVWGKVEILEAAVHAP